MGFWPAKALLSAIELGVFTSLGKESLRGEELGSRIGLHPRGIWDFLDSLVALKLLEREGNGPEARYRNSEDASRYLVRSSPHYIGGFLEMANARLYRFWGELTEALRTGKPQNEIKATGAPVFAELYSQPERLEQFLHAMAGYSLRNFEIFADKFDFSRYGKLVDVGGAEGQLSMAVARRHPHMKCITTDLDVVEPIARKVIAAAGLSDRVSTMTLDFFAEPIPEADVVTMGMILHDWNLEKKKHLIRSAYKALRPGGAFVAVEALIDDERRKNVFGLMMSLNMLIEFGDAFDFTGRDFDGWCREAGFQRTEVMHLRGPSSAAIAYK
jgi:predicted O-methyltransferase YrrM